MGRISRHNQASSPETVVKSDQLARWLGYFTLFYAAATSFGNYWYTTRIQQHLDEQKFLQSNVGLISSLKPVASISCYNVETPSGGIVSYVTIQNTGTYTFRVTKLSRELRGASDDTLLLPAKVTVPSYDNGMDMDISPGQQTVSSDPFGKSGGFRSWDDVDVRAQVEVSTPDVMLDYVKKVLGDAMDSEALKAYGTAMVRCRGKTGFVGPIPPMPINPGLRLTPPPPPPPPNSKLR